MIWHSKRSLKYVLLYNGNKYISILVDSSVHMKKYNEKLIKYETRKWVIFCYLEMVKVLLHQQWLHKNWPLREMLFIGDKYIINDGPKSPPPPPPATPIKVGIIKLFVKALNKVGN